VFAVALLDPGATDFGLALAAFSVIFVALAIIGHILDRKRKLIYSYLGQPDDTEQPDNSSPGRKGNKKNRNPQSTEAQYGQAEI